MSNNSGCSDDPAPKFNCHETDRVLDAFRHMAITNFGKPESEEDFIVRRIYAANILGSRFEDKRKSVKQERIERRDIEISKAIENENYEFAARLRDLKL